MEPTLAPHLCKARIDVQVDAPLRDRQDDGVIDVAINVYQHLRTPDAVKGYIVVDAIYLLSGDI